MVADSSPGADRSTGARALRLEILGPLRLWRGEVELDPGPRQQAAFLAALLARADQPIGRGDLIDLLWEDAPPASALNVIHKYVGALRRVLEPDLSARATGSYLQRRGDGYLFASRGSGLDMVAFRGHVEAARHAAGRAEPGVALDSYVDALALWRGSAGDGLGLGARGTSVFVALNGEFLRACVAAAELAVSLGRPQRVLAALQLAATMAPWDENVHAALVTSLAAVGQRAEALAVLRAVRTRLADDLGIDPGPALRAAQQRVLADSVTPASPAGARRRTADASGAATGLIGRAGELEDLGRALGSALDGGSGVVIIDGEPGVGKTRLLGELAARAERRGALVVWGTCLGGDGTPSMWPWVRLVGAMLDVQRADERADWLAGELGRLLQQPEADGASSAPSDGGARFRLLERVVALVGRTAARRPVVLVIDDLQWADAASLQLLSHLAAQLPGGAMILGALRDRAPVPGAELSRHLAMVSRVPGHHRIHLDPLARGDVAELVRRETGDDPGEDAIRHIYARTAGNPFFVRELARLLADTGAITVAAAGGSTVPATVRDVVRSRTDDLGEDVRRLLQIAALVGRETPVDLLAHAAAVDVATCLDRLEPLGALGVLEPTPGDPFSFRFPHDLVREAVAEVMAPRQASELHRRIADALEAGVADDDSLTERLAFHLWAAGPLADASRTATALMRAGDRAARKSAFEAAERQLQSAIQVARTAGLADLEVSAVGPLADVFWKQGRSFASYADLLARAERLARGLGHDAKAADFLYMRVVGAFTHHHPDTKHLMRRLIEYGERSADPTSRIYARYMQARDAYENGELAVALRHMESEDWAALHDVRWRPNPMGDLQLFAPVFQGLLTGIGGDVPAAQSLLAAVEDDVRDEPYAISVWALWTAFTAEWVGDPAWALRVTSRWRAADPRHFFVNVDPPMRVCRCWARALSGEDPAAAAAEAEQVVVTTMLDPPRFGVTRDYALVAEMYVAAGMPHEAGAALDHADRLAEAHDEPFAEPLRLLMRAKVLQARGEPAEVVRAVADRAKAVSADRGAHIIARRVDQLLGAIRSE